MLPIQSAILKTLAYADIFDQALTIEELERYLIGYEIDNIKNFYQNANGKKFETLTLCNLPGRDELMSLKQPQLQTQRDKLEIVRKSLWLFTLLPWVKMVGVTGSVAGGTPKSNDDIDLLIITQPRRLWISRLLLTIFLTFLGKRRKPNDDPNQVNNKLCLNMWLSMDNLSESHQDLYTANEFARIIPVLDRQQTYQYYLKANSWITKYLPNFKFELGQTEQDPTLSSENRIIDKLDRLAEKFQRNVMKRPTIETIEQDRLAFHPHDYRAEVLQKYNRRLKQIGIKD